MYRIGKFAQAMGVVGLQDLTPRFVKAAVVIQEGPSKIKGIEVQRLQGVKRMACIVHKGRPETLQEAYEALNRWIEANRFQAGGPVREVFLNFGQTQAPEEQVIEVQIPLLKISGKEKKMEPRIVRKGEFKVIGMRYVGKNEHGEISQMWVELNPRIKEIPNLTRDPEYGDVTYGVCGCVEGAEPGVFEYIACLPVSSIEKVPEGMVGKVVPEQTYAVMEAHGIKDIGPTYEYIIKKWLPSSNYLPGDGPDFELYPEEFDPEDPESSLYIFFPVKKK
jgi:AraC family transcriptional regulator